MTIETAIKRAIEGGYHGNFRPLFSIDKGDQVLQLDCILMDPAFWITFSKAHFINDEVAQKMWRSMWHDFISDLAEGKSIADFFKNL